MRRASKRDASEPAIVQALEAIGARVYRLNEPDLPDLLVARVNRAGVKAFSLIEAKSKGGKLKPGQARVHAELAGFPIGVAYTPEQAIALVCGQERA